MARRVLLRGAGERANGDTGISECERLAQLLLSAKVALQFLTNAPISLRDSSEKRIIEQACLAMTI
jgi:hypothetical protein